MTIGDMTTTACLGAFTLVYLVFSKIMNVTTQDDQLAVFANAARAPGAWRVLRGGGGGGPAAPGAPGEAGWVFTFDPDHVGIETYDLVG